MKDKTLEDRCVEVGGFDIELLGNVYCTLAINKKIECYYLSKEKDQNGLYNCVNPLYQSLRLDNIENKKYN